MRLAAFPLLLLAGCSDATIDSSVDGYDSFEDYVAAHRVGNDSDHWIEMKNAFDEWERVGLIFGYNGDYDECLKAIEGLKSVNYEREYRCVPAN